MINIFKKVILYVIIVLAGIFLITDIYHRTERYLRSNLILQSELALKTLDCENIKALKGSAEDINLPEYLALTETMSFIHSKNKNFHFFYILRLDENRDFIVAFGNVHENAPDYVQMVPGELFHKTHPVMFDLMDDIVQNYTIFTHDKWGTWLSSGLQIRDPETGEIIGLFGIERDVKEWKRFVIERISYPAIIIIILICLIIVCLKYIQSKEIFFSIVQRMHTHREAIDKLTLMDIFSLLGFEQSLQAICKQTAETMCVDFVSIWLVSFDKKYLTCITRYDATDRSFSQSESINIIDDLPFIEYIQREKVVAISNVHEKSPFKEFYEKNEAITKRVKSLLTSVILPKELYKGLLVIETNTTQRDWFTDEEVFADNIAAVIGQMFNRHYKDKAELELYESNLRFLNTMESILEGFIYFTKEFEHKFVNKKAYQILNITPEMVENHSIISVIPEDIATLFSSFLMTALKENKDIVHTEFIQSLNEWIEFRIYPTKNDVSLFFSDVTHEKMSERAFIENQKSIAVGEMAHAFSHDFNNYLQVIMGNIQVLEELLKSRSDLTQYIQTIQDMTSDAATRVVLPEKFSGAQKSVTKYERVNLVTIASRALMQATTVWEKDIDNRKNDIIIEENLLPVPDTLGNDGELRTVLYGLIKNSFDAMPEGGTITVETGIKPEGIYLHISDTGIGMTEEVRNKIFQPFFSTKSFNIGKGLNLFSAYNIIKEHSGSLNLLFSEKDVGTKFEILLPFHEFLEELAIVKVERADETEDKAKTPGKKSDLRILWVDDDEMIRSIIEDFVEVIGYSVTLAENGEHALEIMAENDFNILITDIGMPKMSGWQLIERVNELYPNKMKIYVVSGWGNQISDEEKDKFGVEIVLSKPVKLSQLKSILEQ